MISKTLKKNIEDILEIYNNHYTKNIQYSDENIDSYGHYVKVYKKDFDDRGELIKRFIINSYISMLEEMRDRLEGKKKDLGKYESYVAIEINAHNKALQGEIDHIDNQLTALKKMV